MIELDCMAWHGFILTPHLRIPPSSRRKRYTDISYATTIHIPCSLLVQGSLRFEPPLAGWLAGWLDLYS